MATTSTGFQPEAKGLAPVALPGRLNYHHDINADHSSGAATLKRHMEMTLAAANALNARRQMVDRTITETANLLQIEKAVADFRANYEKAQANAVAAVRSSLTLAETKLKNAVGIVPTANGREIRDRLAVMSPEARTAAMREAFATGDKEVIGAIVGFSKVMHGLDAAEVTPLYDKYMRDTAHAEYGAVEDHKKYLKYAESNDASVYGFATEALKGCNGYIKAKEAFDTILASFGEPEADEESEAA